MGDQAMSDGNTAPVWRRLAAAVVDGVFFLFVASLISVSLYAATDGRLRAYVFQPAERCAPTENLAPAVAVAALAAVPADQARVVSATACRRLFLGLESGRFVSVAVEAQRGETLMRAAVLQPVDRSGQPVRPVSLGFAYPLAFVLFMALAEGVVLATPGKAALGLRVVSVSGDRLGFARALGRNLIVYGWLVAGAVLVLVLPQLGRLAPALLGYARAIWIGELVAVGTLALIALAWLLTGRPTPAYDRWTGARVVRA